MGVIRVLAVDTSSWWAGIAVAEAEGDEVPSLVAEARVLVRDSHAARLLPLIEAVLSASGLPRESVDAYAAVRGPGSFTGIRIGLGLLRGLGVASGRPCVGIGALEAMTEAFGPAAAERIPLLDAGRDEVYGARFDPAGSPPASLEAPWLGPVERAGAGTPGVAFGSGAARHGARLVRACPGVVLAPAPSGIAGAAARLALTLLRRGAGDGEGMSPLYLRPADAEIAR